jgi:hypothetical protein
MIDLTGQRFGLLTVLYQIERPDWAKDKSIYWMCKCDCGVEKIIGSPGLRNGKTKSCGCTLYTNLTGKRFGILTVIKEYGRDKNRKRTWLCRCECGEEKVIEASSLMNGFVKSCGCLKHKKQDLVGRKFGMLTVISRSRVDKNRDVFWHCLCDCGNEKEVRGRSLKDGSTKSCGCLSINKNKERAEDLTGQRFGKLVALEIVRAPTHKRGFWLCQCDCGNIKVVAARGLKSGKTLSCGCYRKERLFESNSLEKSESAFNDLIYTYKYCAKNRGYEFLLTKDEFKYLTSQNCFYCGKPPSTIRKGRPQNGDYLYNGIDRIDNFKGYTMDNVVPCCYECNWGKRNKTINEFLEWVKDIYIHSIKDKEE